MSRLTQSIAAAALLASTSFANANLISNGDFDSNLGLSGTQWKVFNAIDGWNTLSGPGIEVQHNTIVGAHSGSQYVELDSHSNSSMYQEISGLTIGGLYDLSFWYHTRTNNGGNDNGIELYWGESTPGTLQLSVNDLIKSQTYEWIEYSTTLFASAETMFLTFAANGLSNSLGGFIDTVSMTAKVPEPATLLLFGIGLAGLYGARRQQKQS